MVSIFETNSQYVFGVSVSDGTLTSVVTTVTITIEDVNDEPPVITPGQTITISETAPDGSLHGPILATDPDTTGTIGNWEILSGNIGDALSIDPVSGHLIVADATGIDFDPPTSATSFTLTVRVDDGRPIAGTTTETVIVEITDENDETPEIVLPTPTLSVFEDASVGTVIGTLTATDADANTTLQDWTILSGNDKGVFNIDASSGQLSIADATHLDFESTTSYLLDLTVSDGTNTSTITGVPIDVLNVIEGPEISVRDASGNLLVDGVGTIDFGTIIVGATAQTSLTFKNHGDSDLVISGVNLLPGLTLPTTTFPITLTPGQSQVVDVEITSSSVGTASSSAEFLNNDGTSDGLDESEFLVQFSVTVTPDNVPPLFFDDTTIVAGSLLTLGSYLGRTPVFDPDGDGLSYAIVGATGSTDPFSIDPDTGRLVSGKR